MKFSTSVAALALSLMIASPVMGQYSINMRDVDVRAFASDAAKVTGLTLVVDGRVNQKVSVVSQRSMSRTEYFYLLSTLRAKAWSRFDRGGSRIHPIEGARATYPEHRNARQAAISSPILACGRSRDRRA